MSHFFSKPSYFKNGHSKPGQTSDRIPEFHFLNFYFLARYFLRALGSVIPPVELKNIFYRLGGVRLGRKAFVGESVYFVDGFMGDLIEIEEEAVLSPKCVLVAMAVPGDSFLQRQYKIAKIGKIVIKKGAWIGVGAVILPGVTVGEGAIVGANAVVTKDVPPYEVWVGSPARFLKNVADYGEVNHV